MNNYMNQGAPERQRKSDECYARIIGFVRPVTNREGDMIKVFACKNGKSVIHFNLERRKPLQPDASGQPREKISLFKVKAFTNARLSEDFLKGIVPGMKIGITAEPIIEYPKDASGAQLPAEVVFEAFSIELLEYPMQRSQQPQQTYPAYQPAQPGYPQGLPQQQPRPYAPASYPNQAYGQPGGQYVPQGGFAPQQPQQRPQPASHPAPQQYQGPSRYAAPTPPPYYKPAPQPADMPDFDNLPEA